LFLKQKKAVRLISNTNFRAHTAEIFKDLKILPLNQMIESSKVKFMHKFSNNRLPFSFTNSWQKNGERVQNRQLRNAEDFFIPPHQYESLRRLPLFSFPASWNSIDQIKLNNNEKAFLRILKGKFLQNLN
jgi:hypothetical protein